MRRPRALPPALAALAAALATAAAGEAPASLPAPPADPFSIWDGVTQLFPAPGMSHAETAEATAPGGASSPSEPPRLGSHAEFAETAELNMGLGFVDNGGQLEFVDNSRFPPRFSLVGEFPLPDSAPEGLSGIAWMGSAGLDCWNNDCYQLAEDSGGRLHFATIGINRRTGAVTNATVAPLDPLAGASDLEGVAIGAIPLPDGNGRLPVAFWSDERGPALLALPLFLSEDREPASVPLPEPLRHCRPNRALESLALSADGRILWTANEGPLPEDGPEPTTGRGGLVRLFALDTTRILCDQSDGAVPAAPPPGPRFWFYELDPPPGVSFRPLPDPFNGLAELCALPDGRLLALERAYGFVERPEGGESPGSLITISIYLIDPLSSPPSAARTAAAPRPAALAKTLLWRGLTGRANYEGMTLGPELDDGSRALLLVSDGDVTRKGAFAFPWAKRLLALRLRP